MILNTRHTHRFSCLRDKCTRQASERWTLKNMLVHWNRDITCGGSHRFFGARHLVLHEIAGWHACGKVFGAEQNSLFMMLNTRHTYSSSSLRDKCARESSKRSTPNNMLVHCDRDITCGGSQRFYGSRHLLHHEIACWHACRKVFEAKKSLFMMLNLRYSFRSSCLRDKCTRQASKRSTLKNHAGALK